MLSYTFSHSTHRLHPSLAQALFTLGRVHPAEPLNFQHVRALQSRAVGSKKSLIPPSPRWNDGEIIWSLERIVDASSMQKLFPSSSISHRIAIDRVSYRIVHRTHRRQRLGTGSLAYNTLDCSPSAAGNGRSGPIRAFLHECLKRI